MRVFGKELINLAEWKLKCLDLTIDGKTMSEICSLQQLLLQLYNLDLFAKEKTDVVVQLQQQLLQPTNLRDGCAINGRIETFNVFIFVTKHIHQKSIIVSPNPVEVRVGKQCLLPFNLDAHHPKNGLHFFGMA